MLKLKPYIFDNVETRLTCQSTLKATVKLFKPIPLSTEGLKFGLRPFRPKLSGVTDRRLRLEWLVSARRVVCALNVPTESIEVIFVVKIATEHFNKKTNSNMR